MTAHIPVNPFKHGPLLDALARICDEIAGAIGLLSATREQDHLPFHVHTCVVYGGTNQFGWWMDPAITRNYPGSLPINDGFIAPNMLPAVSTVGHMLSVKPDMSLAYVGETAYWIDSSGAQVPVESMWGFDLEAVPQTGRLDKTNPASVEPDDDMSLARPPAWLQATNGFEADNTWSFAKPDYAGVMLCRPCPGPPGSFAGILEGEAAKNSAVVMVHEQAWDWWFDDDIGLFSRFVYGWFCVENPVNLCMFAIPGGCVPPPEPAVSGTIMPPVGNPMLLP